MLKCHQCRKVLDKRNVKHIYTCPKKDVNKDKDIIKEEFYLYNYSGLNKEDFVNFYVNKKFSLPDLEREFGIPYSVSIFLIKLYGLKKRNLKEANQLPGRSDKYKKTCLKKYGVSNVSKREEIKEKKKKTFLEHYGVDNIWKDHKYYEELYQNMVTKYGKGSVPNLHGNANYFGWKTVTEKRKKERLSKLHKGYKKYWENLSDDEKTAIIQKRCKNIVYSFNSKLEKRVSDILSSHNVSFTRQFWVCKKSYDIRISKTSIIIEVNGDFWHANPSIYASEDVLNFPGGYISAKELWLKDKTKKEKAEKYGYKVYYLWENFINGIDDTMLWEYIKGNILYEKN